MEAQVKQYFKDFPAKHSVYETSDGLLFHEKGDAGFHAQSLTDKEVIQHRRAKYEAAPANPPEGGEQQAPEIKPAAKQKKGKSSFIIHNS